MSTAGANSVARWHDLKQALSFAQRSFHQWYQDGKLQPYQIQALESYYAARIEEGTRAAAAGQPCPATVDLPEPRPAELANEQTLRYESFLEAELRRHSAKLLLTVAQMQAFTAEVSERQDALRRQHATETVAEVLPVRPSRPRRRLLEFLLDPRSIQGLLGFGGALMLVGLVILLWVNNYFTPPVLAITFGLANAAVLVGGWGTIRYSRYQLAGRALTLLACLIMPLNLWYYHTHGLITLSGHLWVAALAINVLYAASALVLRDDRLLTLPERIKRHEGLFRILSWR
jgi:hypothetical protein